MMSRLRPLLRETLQSYLLGKNLIVARAVDVDHLAHFFETIRPVSTNHELIRVGGETDGGYLVPDDLEDVVACFSPGVSTVAEFELGMANRGIPCFLADYSVEKPPIQNKLFHFEKKFLGSTEDSVFVTLEGWVQRNAPNRGDLILQMDIEGAEYGVVFDTSAETLRKFRILVIEFHELHALFEKRGSELIRLTFMKLLRDFDIVHIHPNNGAQPRAYGEYQVPPMLEITFLRKDRISARGRATEFPHRLDRSNFTGYDDFPLPKCWYRDV